MDKWQCHNTVGTEGLGTFQWGSASSRERMAVTFHYGLSCVVTPFVLKAQFSLQYPGCNYTSRQCPYRGDKVRMTSSGWTPRVQGQTQDARCWSPVNTLMLRHLKSTLLSHRPHLKDKSRTSQQQPLQKGTYGSRPCDLEVPHPHVGVERGAMNSAL